MAAAVQCELFDRLADLLALRRHTMSPRLVLLLLVALTGCARPVPTTRLRAPDPNGCYAIVYERPSFEGAGDVLNGPVRLPMLDQVPQTNEENWHRRIRSVRVGPAATVTAFAETAFNGYSQRFERETEHARLEQTLSARIQSLEIACVDRPGQRE
jgi:hypothetical protein